VLDGPWARGRERQLARLGTRGVDKVAERAGYGDALLTTIIPGEFTRTAIGSNAVSGSKLTFRRCGAMTR
jgi:hypothetical protein